MKATELLKSQHQEVSKLFKLIESSKTAEKKRAYFEELGANLASHDGIEREIFYPACEEQMGMTDLLGEALVEHGVIEFSLFKADQCVDAETFDYYVKVLKEMVEHHVEEEEKEFFPKVEKAFAKERLEELGEEMEAAFEEKKATDFREPVIGNLQEVLAGALKTTPSDEREPAKKPAKSAKKATKRPASTTKSTRA